MKLHNLSKYFSKIRIIQVCYPQTGGRQILLQFTQKGNKKELCNYRPVSLTSIVSKVMESTVRDLIMDDPYTWLFSDKQYTVLLKAGQ